MDLERLALSLLLAGGIWAIYAADRLASFPAGTMLQRALVLLLLLPTPSVPQAVRGTILDATSGERVGVVEIRVLNGAGRTLFSVLSDTSGNFEVPVPGQAPIRLAFERAGYEPVTSKPLSVLPGQVLELEVRLVPAAVPSEAIRVRAERVTNQRATLTGAFTTVRALADFLPSWGVLSCHLRSWTCYAPAHWARRV